MSFKTLLTLVNLFYAICLLALVGLLLRGKVDEFFEQPQVVVADQYRPAPAKDRPAEKIVNGIHQQTGLIVAPGYELVKANCTICHSAKLVTQNHATREGWASMIDWMQATQGLWDLGHQEPAILDYLAAHYAPEEIGRRANVDVEAIEWYVLELPK